MNITPTHYTNSGNITTNPLFVSTTDFHLTSASPGINAGIQLTAPSITTDYDGVTIGNPPDIGAYEFLATGIELMGNKRTFKVFPNPVTDELTIESKGNNDKISFNILDARGQIVYEGNLKEKVVVQTTNLSPGVYLIKIGDGRIFEFKKIIKV